ncbi:MAG: 30S ribosomal protein S20 [Armatimonadetes bacterium]|nr:MAG: 30S ribosomal protein S20 [Armatimonadota bacterium]GIV03019.1 MAG: 30S ribosomal protein S20 [Fimbriimonadales bacterium]
MPNIRSAKKDLRRSLKRRLRNQSTKSMLKTLIKKARLAAGTEEAAEHARLACKMLDKAAERGIIHKNQAARRKARLMKAIHAAKSA